MQAKTADPAGEGRAVGRSRERWRKRVAEIQRARLLEAMAEVVAERGLRGASTAVVARRAGVSRATFSDQFDSPEDCFLALLDWMLERVAGLVATGIEREPIWSEGVLAGLEALLGFLDREPARARACLLEGMTVPPSRLFPRAQVLAQLGRLIDRRARRELSLERQPPKTMPEATIGSVLAVLRRRLLSGEAPPFVALLAPLAEVVVAPYFGPSAAALVAGRGRERAEALLAACSAGPAPGDVEVPGLLRHANARRMRACIRYLVANPDASNRAVAAGIGISHAGQVSVLLARLHGAGLLEKESGGAGRPNAWRLSAYGARVAEALERWR